MVEPLLGHGPVLDGSQIAGQKITHFEGHMHPPRPDWSPFPTVTLFAVSVIEESLALQNSSLNECTLALLLFPCVLSHLLDLIHRSMQMNPLNESVPPLFSVRNLSFAVPREAAFSLAQKMN